MRENFKACTYKYTRNTPRPRLQSLHVIANKLAKIKPLENLALYCIAQSTFIYSIDSRYSGSLKYGHLDIPAI